MYSYNYVIIEHYMFVKNKKSERIMTTKARIKRMFSEEGNCFDVAIDHGFFNEYSFLSSIENMKHSVETVVKVYVTQIRQQQHGSSNFWHTSDLDPLKPINWKRRIATNGEYGCMGDLGMHVLHLLIRFGWKPQNVRSLLTKVVEERPDLLR